MKIEPKSKDMKELLAKANITLVSEEERKRILDELCSRQEIPMNQAFDLLSKPDSLGIEYDIYITMIDVLKHKYNVDAGDDALGYWEDYKGSKITENSIKEDIVATVIELLKNKYGVDSDDEALKYWDTYKEMILSFDKE